MGFFDVAVSLLHWLAENAELERERRQRQPTSESMLEGRRRALGGISDADRLLREYGNLMRDVLSTVTVVMLQNDRNKDAFRQALLLKSSTASRSTASRQNQHDFSSHIWRASKLLLLPLQQLMLRIEPSPSSSTIVLIFDMLVSLGLKQPTVHVALLSLRFPTLPYPAVRRLSPRHFVEIGSLPHWYFQRWRGRQRLEIRFAPLRPGVGVTTSDHPPC